MAVLISWLALFATLYQLYLQRTHNEKSLQPLGQIDLEDRQGHLYIRITNNGMGPMIIDRLIFRKDGNQYTTIENCLELSTRTYTQVGISESVRKVILPHSHLTVFETRVEDQDAEKEAQQIRQQLSSIALKVEFRDIYNNKMTIERDFQWFSRYIQEKVIEQKST
ncbi:hypothetical protein DUE52_20675 [Larkinella punicea]|uniref:Uncharacterized protein n=1 Tax=Larkinella punicea TaxID=2315727 RepID=A0A368JJG3_9BACT|nr:hypothetical protein DUE52_20675 [Larkinella punicea]